MKPVKLAAVVLAAAIAVGTGTAAQEHYPSRLITVVVPLTAGTTIDILARLFAEGLSKRFGQQVIVANRPGAGGLIAAQAVATAPADGYTVLLANSGHAILGTLNKNLPFDPIGDFAAVSLIGDAPTLVTVAPSLGVRSLTEFVELAKAKPGAINYGSAGVGTATHLAGMYFAAQTGTDLVHVPYTVSSTIIADLLGGRGRDRLRRNQAARAGTICDDDLLTESLRQALGEQPGKNVDGRARGQRNDHGDQPGGIVLLRGSARAHGNRRCEHDRRQLHRLHASPPFDPATPQRAAMLLLASTLSFVSFRWQFLSSRHARVLTRASIGKKRFIEEDGLSGQ